LNSLFASTSEFINIKYQIYTCVIKTKVIALTITIMTTNNTMAATVTLKSIS